MAAPSRGQRAPITFVMVLDRSASMREGAGPIYPIDMAREAAVRTLENLRAEDYVGVLTFTYPGEVNYKWDVPIRLLGDGLQLRAAQDAVSRIEAGGGTFMYRALEGAVDALLAQNPTENMHILLLTDGKSQDGSQGEFQALAARAKRLGVTISTISLGTNTDAEILALIADEGGGRFLESPDPADLPRIMIAESQAALAENTQQEEPDLRMERRFDLCPAPALLRRHDYGNR